MCRQPESERSKTSVLAKPKSAPQTNLFNPSLPHPPPPVACAHLSVLPSSTYVSFRGSRKETKTPGLGKQRRQASWLAALFARESAQCRCAVFAQPPRCHQKTCVSLTEITSFFCDLSREGAGAGGGAAPKAEREGRRAGRSAGGGSPRGG